MDGGEPPLTNLIPIPKLYIDMSVLQPVNTNWKIINLLHHHSLRDNKHNKIIPSVFR